MNTLLAIPQYSDLLDNQGDKDESEHGHLLVSSRWGRRMEMAGCIGEARAAEHDEDLNDETDAPVAASNMRTAK
jgi:hypothetical protein